MQLSSIAPAFVAPNPSASGAKTNAPAETEISQAEPLTFNPNLTIGLSLPELEKRDLKKAEADAAAYSQAGDSFLVMRAEIGKLDKSISTIRPDIKSSDWDFSLKDGKFVVTSSRLKLDDIKLLESKLNGDAKLTSAAKSFMKATLSLETTHDNPSYTNQNTYAGRMQNYTFYKVDDQLNGKLGLKNMMAETARYTGLDRKGSYSMPGTVGYVALMVVASHLTSSDKKIGYEVFPTVAR